MKLEAVTVCRDYSDLLAHTLPLNTPHFDRLVVVTSPADKATQRICEYLNVACVQSDALANPEFPKGHAINDGLQHLTLDGWVVHLDADIALPPLTRHLLHHARLDPGCVYGIDRHLIQSAKQWRNHQLRPRLQHECGVYVHTEAYPIATRFAPEPDGWLPVGFFQMWNPGHSGIQTYPASHSTAGRTDMLHARQWPRDRRQLLPELVAYHLESEPAPQGANWEGRQTRPFTCERWWDCWWPWRWWRRRRHRRHRHHHYHHHHRCEPLWGAL